MHILYCQHHVHTDNWTVVGKVAILVVSDDIVISGVNDVIRLAQHRKMSTAELMILCACFGLVWFSLGKF